MSLIALINQLHASLLNAARKEELNRIFGELAHVHRVALYERGRNDPASQLSWANRPLVGTHFVRQVRELRDRFIAGMHIVSMIC